MAAYKLSWLAYSGTITLGADYPCISFISINKSFLLPVWH
ncbi:hypothetical protein SEHO0A_00026 [Salmonella enterica subsp. houtenae str. ATCC BAA-1581]|nr:hypothetical protein SEHO0A_00026 [Salmonella enterica subsp. houtenae str. ATCC BAA-1581]